MNITKHTVPSVTYTLTVNGEVLETAGADKPLLYIHGSNAMIPGFEKELEGKEVGSKFDFTVSSEEGYGDVNPEAVVELPKASFEVEGEFQSEVVFKGAMVPMQDQAGNPLRGIVQDITDEVVKMDFNHPLAGQELSFKGEVIDVRAADAEEIEHGHVHGPGGHEH